MKFLRRILFAILVLVLAGTGAFHLRVEHLVNRPVPAPGEAGAGQHYFAYGTNMPTRYLYNVRGVLPAQSAPGFIQDHEIAFLAPGINAIEPAFAFLLKAQGERAHGVLHRVSREDLVKVKESEGPDYEWATLPVEVGDGSTIPAQTLVRLSRGDPGTPSRRYLAILIEGAREHRLPAEYVTRLEGIRSVYFPVASELMGDVLHVFVMRRSGKCASVITC